jgi:hypothetical protein
VIVSIMQPYLFPYLGYFQLMAASQVFVVYDDVQFIKGGWIHRNRILLNGTPVWMTLPVASAPHTVEIRDRAYIAGEHRGKLLRRLHGAYRTAPQFGVTMALVERILAVPTSNVAELNTCALREIAELLGIAARIVISSSLEKDRNIHGPERVAGICKGLGATAYLNSIGGLDLYDPRFFRDRGLTLLFLEPQFTAYMQNSEGFVPALSILDVLMHNDVATVRQMVQRFQIRRRDVAEPVFVDP